MNAEFWAILIGLQVAQGRGFSRVIIESDYKVVVELILKSFDGVTMTTIVRRIKEVSRNFIQVKFQFIGRDDNGIAD